MLNVNPFYLFCLCRSILIMCCNSQSHVRVWCCHSVHVSMKAPWPVCLEHSLTTQNCSPNPVGDAFPGLVKPTWSGVCLQWGPKPSTLWVTQGEEEHQPASDHSNVVLGEQESIDFTAWCQRGFRENTTRYWLTVFVLCNKPHSQLQVTLENDGNRWNPLTGPPSPLLSPYRHARALTEESSLISNPPLQPFWDNIKTTSCRNVQFLIGRMILWKEEGESVGVIGFTTWFICCL